MKTEHKKMMSKKEVAAYFGVTPQCVDNWRRVGLLTGEKQPNKHVLFDREQVEALGLTKRTMRK